MNITGKSLKQFFNKHYVKRIDHDILCFTQGLHCVGDYMYESCGSPSGSVSRVRILLKKYIGSNFDYRVVLEKSFDEFLEGLVVVGEYIYVLTWKAGFMYILDKVNLDVVGKCYYEGEGWGLTHDGENFIMSNGSEILTWFQVDVHREKIIKKRELNIGIKFLNELEYVNGCIYVNVWYKDELLKISNRNIVSKKNFNWVRQYERGGVLNGITYDKSLNAFLITGKNWKWIYYCLM